MGSVNKQWSCSDYLWWRKNFPKVKKKQERQYTEKKSSCNPRQKSLAHMTKKHLVASTFHYFVNTLLNFPRPPLPKNSVGVLSHHCRNGNQHCIGGGEGGGGLGQCSFFVNIIKHANTFVKDCRLLSYWQISNIKGASHDILSHFFDNLNCGFTSGKPYSATSVTRVTQAKLINQLAERKQYIPTYFFFSQWNVQNRTMKFQLVHWLWKQINTSFGCGLLCLGDPSNSSCTVK